jgi:hypothetical protein
MDEVVFKLVEHGCGTFTQMEWFGASAQIGAGV